MTPKEKAFLERLRLALSSDLAMDYMKKLVLEDHLPGRRNQVKADFAADMLRLMQEMKGRTG